MYYRIREFFGVSFLLKRGWSSCSTSTTAINQFHKPQINSRIEAVGGSPVSSNAFGQPTHATHPHKILEGEIVPGVRKEELKARRCRLAEIIGSENCYRNKSHIIIIPSSQKKYMSEKIPYTFRQNSDFLYLTGCMEPDSILIISSHGQTIEETVLFLRGKDAHSEVWDGPRTGIEQAVGFFGIDKSMHLIEFGTYIMSFLKEYPDHILWYDSLADSHSYIQNSMKTILSNCSKVWESPKPFIHRMRLYKSLAEQELIKKSCEIGATAIRETIKNSKSGDSEAQIFARIDFECRMMGAEYLAYPPVVAGGKRANIIHYINNDQIIREGDLVLMDAGCEYHSYSSDITRTWPISGKFSPVQKVLYDVVYSVQCQLVDICSEFPSLDQLFNTMCRLLGARLQEAGVISNKCNGLDLSRVAHIFCPHHVSHYLGMDVHDTSTVSRNIPLEPGMVITIEPGAYVNVNNKLANPEFLGLGVRIEDDILITENGPIVLTASCPKHPDDIEKLVINREL